MSDTARPRDPIRFGAGGRFELQPAERRMLVDGRPVALGTRAIDLLEVLADRPEQLIGKNELLDRVWPGLAVEEANLHVQISHLRKLLGGDVIATVPGRGYRFVAPLASGPEAAATPPNGPPAAAVPPVVLRPPRLFGRDADMATLEGLLGDGVCVTLVGPSGVGKTSLARAAAARRTGRCVWVDLAGLTQGSQVAQSLARALGMPLDDADPGPALARALHGDPVLLVLDNAEHLVEATAALVRRVAALDGVAVLVTSQQPLALAGEQVQRLGPLPIESDALPTQGDGGAVALLAARIAAADHRFEFGDASRPVLAEICVQLDGLPLALEMAAARVPMLGLSGVRDALARRFALLTKGHRGADLRHRTLQQALDWSYRLLGPAEQRLFRVLGVFAGGFTVELALAAALGPDRSDEQRWATIDSLSSLIDRSLVIATAEDPPRYRLLQTLRAFALERLAETVAPESEEPGVRRRHAEGLLALFEAWSTGDAAAQALCDPELENLRGAIAWARSNDLELAVRLSALATRATTFNAWRPEASRWLSALRPALESPAGLALPGRVQAVWWSELARTQVMRRDPEGAATARHALALLRAFDDHDRRLIAAAAWVRASVHPGPDLDRACVALEQELAAVERPTVMNRLQVRSALTSASEVRGDIEAVLTGRLQELELAHELGTAHWVDAIESNIVIALNQLDRHVEAADRGLALLARLEARSGPASGNLPWVFSGLLDALAGAGRVDEALAIVPRAWDTCEAQGTSYSLLGSLVVIAAARGRFDDAALAIGHIRTLQATGAMPEAAEEERLFRRLNERLVAALGEPRVQALTQDGRSVEGELIARWARAPSGPTLTAMTEAHRTRP